MASVGWGVGTGSDKERQQRELDETGNDIQEAFKKFVDWYRWTL